MIRKIICLFLMLLQVVFLSTFLISCGSDTSGMIGAAALGGVTGVVGAAIGGSTGANDEGIQNEKSGERNTLSDAYFSADIDYSTNEKNNSLSQIKYKVKITGKDIYAYIDTLTIPKR